jgi:hypothetical protein
MSDEALIDLDGEFAVAHRALRAFEGRIRPRVSSEIWNAPAPVLGVMSATFDGRGDWAPFAHRDHLSGGVLSLLVAVRAEDGADDDITHPVPRWCVLQGPEIIDLVAMPLGAPHRWARRTGLARTLGRIPYLEPKKEVRVHRTPAGWLRGDGSGIAVLESERAAMASILNSVTGDLLADDEAHARELDGIVARPMRTPRIRVAAPARRAAA